MNELLGKLGPGFPVLIFDEDKEEYRFGNVIYILAGYASDDDWDFESVPYIIPSNHFTDLSNLRNEEINKDNENHDYIYVIEVHGKEISQYSKEWLVRKICRMWSPSKYFYLHPFVALLKKEGLLHYYFVKGQELSFDTIRFDFEKDCIYPFHLLGIKVVSLGLEGVACICHEGKEYSDENDEDKTIEEDYIWCDGYLYPFPYEYSIVDKKIHMETLPVRPLKNEEIEIVRRSWRGSEVDMLTLTGTNNHEN